jgi:23S rRNA (guanosine2251-2'-O)-methyltransferase
VTPERVAGFHPVREALRRAEAGDARVARVLVDRKKSGARRAEIEALSRRAGARLEIVDDAVLTRFYAGVHNGFAAEVERTGRVAPGGADPELVVLAEDVQDPRNLGALLRVCEGAGVGRVLLRERGSAPLSESAVKASAGAASWIEFERIGSSAQALANLKEDGFWIYGLAMEGEPPWRVDLKGKVAICVGGEESGLRRLTRERCDGLIGLPMLGRVESLNLATAAAAVLYEAVRQRTRGG